LINTTEKQTKLWLMICILIKWKLINWKGTLVLKEDYAKMIVKSYKSRSEQSQRCYTIRWELLQAYKRAQYLQYTSFRKPGEEIKTKSTQLI
jgi:hypothetical protein